MRYANTMREHLKIILLSIIFGTIIPPLFVATIIGILSGEPLIIIYPAVIPVSIIMGCPISFIGSALLIVAGLKKINGGKDNLSFKSWATKFSAMGLLFGMVASTFVVLIVERGNVVNILGALLYIAPNFLLTSLIVSSIFALG